ncbi:glycosyltransferase family 4 protein [Aetokthonos hydrillicola Thurmond2011]|jgi:glycosyltransferase involved in cell wall biosynthesis|uniref:Glycosyltransferase family 4 protein n=1 Tax=Aetokthonos hydrillicola Thurmond2011 TaxID=2712845 RepID=A0AAP5I544_9CYAN|nr:glycosyltransferase family 4 protein [Aetokthonos hydrillicola]MBO3458290.1 glycosyltransferase family 4 protein [Aetokthonos hydrillicola CCALA 1050]MBW4585852.1 glycosyltransferase family 4 protein [Aetokthonos hydrillicola CCALA 1050]MDR9893922.1 glycosyltransferase family 4 protein [Aetokthonos hydrillicola Thurmond2011]
MQNISQFDTAIREETTSPDILVISRTFLPKEGGIEEYVYNRCLQEPRRVILLAASHPGDKVFDQTQPFPVYRWFLPKYIISGFVGSILKQIFCLIGSFVLAIKLYFRYRYSYIEWGHGYDFPSILLLSYFLPIRFFIYLHGNDVLCPLRNPLLRSLFELTLQQAEGIVCNSSFTRDFLSNHFQFNTPTYVINPVVRPEKFGIVPSQDSLDDLRVKIRKLYQIPETSVVILSVGRLVKRKGFDRAIENLKLLLASGFDVHYIICGRGVMESELKSLACRLQIEERVHFAGYVPDKQLAGYYAACDIFTMLTFFDSKNSSIEGFGIVYLEAGYFGKPVIASRVGGVVDAVHHEENGILVDPNSGSEILEAFKRLCEDKNLREQLGCKGRELAMRQTYHRSLYGYEAY